MARQNVVVWLIHLGAILWLASCGQSPSGTLGVGFDPSVPPDQRNSLGLDLNRVQTLSSSILTPDNTNRMGIGAISSSTFSDWLSQRVRLIVGEDFDWQSNEIPVGSIGNFTPVLFDSLSRERDSGNVVTLMTNIGSSIYLDGRDAHTLYDLQTPEGTLRVDTPRVGVIQVGSGLFQTQIDGSDTDSEANSYLRLAVLFHEARHGDGHGQFAGFPHALCPSGDYAGDYACESNQNGPYAVQASLLQTFYQTCQTCTDDEFAGLMLQISDYQSRLLPDAVMNDPTPERLP